MCMQNKTELREALVIKKPQIVLGLRSLLKSLDAFFQGLRNDGSGRKRACIDILTDGGKSWNDDLHKEVSINEYNSSKNG